MMTDPATLAANLCDLLDVEQLDTDLYRGRRAPYGKGRVFGGQVIAQALQAAQRSTPAMPSAAQSTNNAPKTAHSLHAYFMRPGDDDFPILFRVVRDFDGKSFATRRVIASQKGQPILNMACSLQTPEGGLHHQDAMPDVPGPDGLASEAELTDALGDAIPAQFRDRMSRPRPIEIRPVHPRDWLSPTPREPRQQTWFRICAPIPDDPALHRAVLAYASDMALLGTGTLPHGISFMTPSLQSASLDHSLWLHEDFRADDWLLYSCDSPWTGHARSFNRGQIFSQDGRLVASVAQEGLMRIRT